MAKKSPSNTVAKKPAATRSADVVTAAGAMGFPIVGIGCSAGGVEALEKFFVNVPADCGMAFVVIQHLDPRHASILPDLIERSAHIPVKQARNRMKVRPGCVYVIPPSKELTLLHDTLYLLDPAMPTGLRLPVDLFLRTLADDRQERAVGVILSGMGSDGMLGLRAIKEKGGLTLVQDPADAKSSGMPRSAIDAGLADFIAPASALPGQLAILLKQPLRRVDGEAVVAPAALSALEKIIILLRDRCGADFSDYKTSTLYRRIERRTDLHQLHGIADYVRYLRENPLELDLLFKELLIGVTNFFRDPAVWDALRDTVMPELLVHHPGGATLRAWVPACSSGEEAYSLAIVFREALEQFKPKGRFSLQIYATDIDADAIDKARKGLYPGNIAVDVSAERLQRYFVAEDGGWRVGKDIRDLVVFAPQNIISDPPFTKLDILSCRNLLIYIGAAMQKKLLPLFHYALNPNGVLVLGSAEAAGSHAELFEPIDGKTRIFHRVAHGGLLVHPEFPTHQPRGILPALAQANRRDSLEYLTDQHIQQNYAPPAVLVNSDGDIVYISGRTGKYLEPAAGKVNINLHAMARPGLREALTGVIRNAQNQTQPIRLNGLRVGTNGGTQVVDVVVQGMTHPEALRGRVLLVFHDQPFASPEAAGRRKASPPDAVRELELRQAREALRVAHEEMQTSVEEYKSANEELQSTNEELQSTNEELTTSKEELQSLNEELQTVNAELQSKVDELTGVRNDMTNLLNSTEVATVFLDNAMKLRRFTVHATHLFKLIPSDIGRPLTDIVTMLDYADLMHDAIEVLRTLVFQEKQVSTRDGQWYRVRIMPYRTLENMIDGVAITFINISDVKELELQLWQCQASQNKPGEAHE